MKNSFQNQRFRFFELIEKARDTELSLEERGEINTLAASDPGLLDALAESLFIDATLRHDTRLVRDLQANVPPSITPANRRPLVTVILAMAACGMFGLLLFLNSQKQPAGPAPIATLVKANGCKWASSTLPTAQGSRVTAGTYELVEGLATLRFDSGAEVVLEAPSSLELIDSMNCRLLSGTLVSDVPPSAIGFTVDTLKARVVDYGTRFGVSTSEDGNYMVQVLSGKVEVEDHAESKLHKLSAGQNIDRGLFAQRLNPQAPADEPSLWQPGRIVNDGDGWQMISTAYGHGKDTFIETSTNPRTYGKQAVIRAKHSTIQQHLNRKAYLGFDIASFQGKGFEKAELILAIEPSDLGFATLVPDSRFLVYGLTDESGDSWDESNMNSASAPANDPARSDLHLPDPEKSILLGSFEIAQGVGRGNRTLGGQALADFLNTDTNGIVTLIICRETDETAKGGLAHAFATKENGSSTPPLLRLKPKL